MHIVFAASECTPWAKTGGLADVVGALPAELKKLGHRVTTLVPYYRQVAQQMPNLPVKLASVTIPFRDYNRFVRILDAGEQHGAQMYFVDCPELFDRESFYATPSGDYPDNAERFGLFSRAVIEASKVLGVPDVFHVHDWQAAMVSVYMRSTYYFDPVLRKVPSVLTIHNAGYQGWFPPKTTEELLLPWDMFRFDKLEQNDTFNFLKGGCVYADALTTVSPTYAEEIKTPEFGSGLENVFAQRADDLLGILNGVDYTEWNPETDANIAAHYTPKDLKGKKECRRDVLHAFGFDHVSDETPVIGMVTRLATQKGLDLLAQIIDELVKQDMVLMVLGSGEEYYERLFTELSEKYPDKVRVQIGYDNVMAHKIEAGADMFLMPSRYEPCGLNQIYSLKYGTVPIVRATGGLEDTVDEQAGGKGTGFKFSGYSPWAFYDAILRALRVFQNKEEWTEIMQRGMMQDYGWHTSAKQYVQLYERVITQRAWS
ncbi:MAG: glycogen synthase GlgA [Acidobacteria bacterium]|nr:glycogen synthase GlgA [Acidobacteriota bacterium]